jgi:hypothetical protein
MAEAGIWAAGSMAAASFIMEGLTNFRNGEGFRGTPRGRFFSNDYEVGVCAYDD